MALQNPNGQRILIVDDEPRILEVVATYLRRDGYQVETAVDGETARRGLTEFKPDLVVLDLMLPSRVRLRGAERHQTAMATFR